MVNGTVLSTAIRSVAAAALIGSALSVGSGQFRDPGRLNDPDASTIERASTSAVAEPPGCGARWARPVDAPIVDWFRPPPSPYEAGNRGLEYGTVAGQVVVPVASGTVRFAGSVGGRRFVVVDHGDGLWSTYGYLERIDVEVDRVVEVGATTLATAQPGFHLTARRDGNYLDPVILLADPCRPARLVPVPTRYRMPA